MDLQSRFLLDRELFDNLKSYLEVKKSALQDALLLSIYRPPGAPALAHPEGPPSSLLETLQLFNEKWQRLGPVQLRTFDEEAIVEKLSNILWNYVEILEGMARELFEQLKEVPIDEWEQDLYDQLDQTKVHLFLKLKEMGDFLPALEKSLKRFFIKCLEQKRFAFWRKLQVHMRGILDPELKKKIHEAEIFLHEHFVKFSKGFLFLKKTEARLESEQYKFHNFAILDKLDKDKQRQYRRLWRLLNVWEASHKEKISLLDSLIATLKLLFPPGKTTVMLREYLAFLKEKIFEMARHYRTQKDIAAQAVICAWRAETDTLGDVISLFRDYLVATENGKRWPLTSEPRRTKELQQLFEEAKAVDKWLEAIFYAQEMADEDDAYIDLMKFKRIDKLLHDMEQPLISKSVMKRLSNELINDLTHVQELTSPLPEVSELMQDAILRAFNADQKHETLLTTPGFMSLWEVHRGLSHSEKSAAHLKRLKLYKKVTQHLKHWLLEHELTRHTLEAEHEIHDIQETLQEFYHSIDELLPRAHLVEMQKELLEERIFFAHFFQFLRQQNSEGRHIRTEFAFIDTYFNAIDDKLRTLLKPTEEEDNKV